MFEGVRRMARAFDDDHESRRRWRLGLAWASAAAVGVLLLALVRLAFVSPPLRDSEPMANTPSVLMPDEVPTAGETLDQPTSGWLGDTTDAGESVVARPLPKGPFKGQKRPPCTLATPRSNSSAAAG
ncbi:MAG: hypothetical protein ACJ8AN_13940 [Archangium sp.]